MLFMPLVQRHLEPIVGSSLEAFRVVVLHGARQSGKTTLARAVAQRRGGTYVSLDDDAFRVAALDDPLATLSALAPPAVIDEIQLGGDRVVRAVKRIVDDDPTPGRFLLTGSTNFLSVPTISESLAGRARILRLAPFSEAELAGRPPLPFERWLDDGDVATPDEAPDRAEYMRRLCRGGYPEAILLGNEDRRGWHQSYVETIVQRDISEFGDIRRVSAMVELLRWLASNTSTELNTQAACRQLGIDRATFDSYFSWLETVFLAQTLPAWSRKHAARVIRRPKVSVSDTGIAAALLGLNAAALASPTSTAAGPLLETFVVNELMRQLSATPNLRLHHLRDYDGNEVDLVLERADGTIAAIEVKATGNPAENHLKPLRWMRDRIDAVAPGLFRIGVLLHTGQHRLPAGDRILFAPISTLWATQG